MNKTIPLLLLLLSVLALLLGSIFGTLASFQYVFPDFLKSITPFNVIRPLHVSSLVGWIILAATGGIYYHLTATLKLPLYSSKLLVLHFSIFVLIALAIYISFFTGHVGGREYLEFTPYLIFPILLGWLFFGINYFKTLYKKITNWPVYLWMWGTGIVFMIYHLSEAHLWFLPYFRENYVRDLTVQWKSYGSFVGSWNMLVYGTSIFVMAQVKHDDSIGRGKKAFFFYFLGLTNLMFGWAHHTYIIPTQPWIRFVAYGTSMSEWVVLFSIILDWKRSLSKQKVDANQYAYRFLLATDFWVFVNLFIALLISIPYLNFFTHGTHITVLHSMGTTIGINTTILLSSLFLIVNQHQSKLINKAVRSINLGYWLFNSSLFVFLTALMFAGFKRSSWMYNEMSTTPFSVFHESLFPFIVMFIVAGIGLLVSLFLIGIPLIKGFVAELKNTKS